MKRLSVIMLVLIGWTGIAPSGWGQASPQMSSSQSSQVRSPSPNEIRLLQALRANSATAPYPFSTEPRGSRILLRGRVGAKIVHDVAVRLAIDLGIPIDDAITIDTAFNPMGVRGGFGTVPGPGPTFSGGVGFGGPPAFGNTGIAAGGGAYGAGYGGGGYGGYGGGGYGGGYGSNIAPVLAFPSAGSYGGAPSLTAPPIFGRYDDPFYGFDPPAVIYPPWWGALNAQRVQANASFGGAGASGGPGVVPSVAPNGGVATPGQGQASGAGSVGSSSTTTNNQGMPNVPVDPSNGTETDIGVIPDGTIDMAIDGAGVATLRGGVPSMAEKLAIGRRVSQTPGVTQLINLLTIKPALGRINNIESVPPQPTPADTAPDTARTSPAPIMSTPMNPATGVANARPNTSPSDLTGDAALTDRVSRGLADRAATIGAPVRVKVKDGVAQLSGKVGSVYEAMLAYRSVQQTPGIRSVDDRLEFPVPDGSNGSNPLIEKGRPDDVEPYLEAQIRRQAGDIAHIDRVRLQGDSLDLRGTLARPDDRDRFDAIIRSMPILRGYQVHTDLPVASP